jgi:hypothetical protein
MSPRTLWHPSESAFGYGTTPYPDYGGRLDGTNNAKATLGPEAALYWSYSPVDPLVQHAGCAYAFGLDYAWGMSSQRLGFANAVKMKMSVIFGVLHMNFGILIKGTNAIFR